MQPDTTLHPGPFVYTALLTQTGTSAPTANVLKNEIGDIIWTRESQGVYKGTLTGAFKTNKTYFTITLNNTGKTGTMYADINNSDSVIINTNDYTFAQSDDCLKDTPIQISIYR